MANSVIKANIGAVLNSYEGDIVTIKSPIERPFIMNMQAEINPVQDLHGYDKPWAGGNGKNKLNNTGTSQTVNGITFTVNSDGSVKANGTATAVTVINLNIALGSLLTTGQNYILSGCSGGNFDSTFSLRISNDGGSSLVINVNGDTSFTKTDAMTRVQILVRNGASVNTAFYPMIRLASETDASFAPYSNICPISGWTECNLSRTGKNWFKTNASTETIQGVTFTINADGTVSVSGTPTGYAHKTIGFAKVKSSMGTVILSGLADSTNIKWDAIRFYDSNNVLLGDIQDRADDIVIDLTQYPTIDYITAEIKRTSNGTAAGGTVKPQIELGTRATDYEPYNGDTFIIDLDGTRYGGTLDVTSGVINVPMAEVDLGNLDWRYDSYSTRFYATSPLSNVKIPQLTEVPDAYCSVYSVVKASGQGTVNSSISIASGGTPWVKDVTYGTDYSAFKTAMSGQQLVYELATPLTVQLTPTQIEALVGENNVWCSTGQTKLTALEMESIS